jgi:hypothetical protein
MVQVNFDVCLTVIFRLFRLLIAFTGHSCVDKCYGIDFKSI